MPTVLNGWTNYLPCQAGISPTSSYGLLNPGGTQSSASAFTYSKYLFGVAGSGYTSGAWDFQIITGVPGGPAGSGIIPGATIIWDQAVQLTYQGGVGWVMLNGVGLFKTRVVSGQPVPPVFEDGTPADPIGGHPDVPSNVIFLGEIQTALYCQMPTSLPNNAVGFNLLFCPVGTGTVNPDGTYTVPPSGDFVEYPAHLLNPDLTSGQPIPAGSSALGSTNILTIQQSYVQSIFPMVEFQLEQIYVRLESVDSMGNTTPGQALRDAWNTLRDSTLIAGYQGDAFVKFAGGPTDAFNEEGEIDPGNGTQDLDGNVSALWNGPPYTCAIPAGAYLTILHDDWVPNDSGLPNQATYEFSYLLGGRYYTHIDRAGALHDMSAIGSSFYLRHTYTGSNSRIWKAPLVNIGNPIIWSDDTERMYIVGFQNNRWLIWYSDTLGLDVQPLMAGSSQVSLWADGFSGVVPKALPSGGYASAAQNGGQIYFQWSQDALSPGSITPVGPAGSQFDLQVFEPVTGEYRFVISDNLTLHYESTDGLNWYSVTS